MRVSTWAGALPTAQASGLSLTARAPERDRHPAAGVLAALLRDDQADASRLGHSGSACAR